MNRLRRAVVLLALALVTGQALANGQVKQFELDVNELLTLEPAVIPEPVDDSSWYYTPSRKAHIYRRNKAASMVQNQTKQGEDMRLSGDLRPSLYDVRLLPFIEFGNFTTDGFIQITFSCVRATMNISINALQLTIDRASISVIFLNSLTT